MRRQFVGLERRVHTNGRESVDGAGTGADDDLANCCSGAMLMAADADGGAFPAALIESAMTDAFQPFCDA